MTTARQLHARTVDLDPAERVDLVAFAGEGDDGVVWLQGDGGLAARGCALRIELPRGLAGATTEVRDALAAIDVVDEVRRPATGPIAIGALPFDRTAPCSLVVPESLVGRSRDGRQWMTRVALEPLSGALRLVLRPERAQKPDPDGFAITSPRSHQEFEQLVRDAVKTIDAGDLDKIVIAREVVVETNRPIVIANVLERLHALYPSCTVFSMDGFVGASPELLVERRGDRVRCHPLAGTFPRSGDPEADELLAARLQASLKDRNEHRFVIEVIDAALRPLCDRLDVDSAPSILPLRNVLHLATEVAGTLRAPAPDAIALASLLHPTPAVGGAPTAPALAWLADNEPLERSRYGGPVGWVDANGDGSFVVGIRSADVRADRLAARLFAGVGIVAGSQPDTELVETQLKLQALLAALVRP